MTEVATGMAYGGNRLAYRGNRGNPMADPWGNRCGPMGALGKAPLGSLWVNRGRP